MGPREPERCFVFFPFGGRAKRGRKKRHLRGKTGVRGKSDKWHGVGSLRGAGGWEAKKGWDVGREQKGLQCQPDQKRNGSKKKKKKRRLWQRRHLKSIQIKTRADTKSRHMNTKSDLVFVC